MAGQIIINFDGLTAEAAAKLAQGQVDAVKAKIESYGALATKLSSEDALKLERLIGTARADGNCGNGCAGA
jgi:hypothetical protein